MVTRNSVSFNEKLQPAVHDLRVNIANNAIMNSSHLMKHLGKKCPARQILNQVQQYRH